MSFTAVLAPPEWDPSFHGSVHTATMTVCTVLVIFVVVLGTFGNGLVLLSAIQSRKVRTNFDILLVNLAGADFMICCCLSPTFLYLLFSTPPSPREFCGAFLFTSATCGLLSLLTLVAIAAYRESRVRGRLKGALSSTRTAAILTIIYIISIGIALGGTLHVTLPWNESYSTCQAVMNSDDITANNAILFFISPVISISFIIIVFSYSVIARAVRIQTYLRVRALQPLLRSAASKPAQPAVPGSSVPSDLQKMLGGSSLAGKKNEPLRHCLCCGCMAALEKENKAFTMCFVVILIIALCWTPLVISHVVEVITGESIILYQVKLCAVALVFLNSALDPYMYSQNSDRIKRRYGRFFWDILHCECRIPQPRTFRSLVPKKTAPRTLANRGVRTSCVALQFLQKKPGKMCGRKQTCNVNECSKDQRLQASARIYATNLLIYGDKKHGYQASSFDNKRQETTHSKRTHAQNGVRSLVNKTCCHAPSPEDQSLIGS